MMLELRINSKFLFLPIFRSEIMKQDKSMVHISFLKKCLEVLFEFIAKCVKFSIKVSRVKFAGN